jgi:hypothetical protein
MQQAFRSVTQLLRSLARRNMFAGLSGMFLFSAVAWGAGPGQEPLPLETQRAFAVRFAPSFVFSPDEVFFPCDPFMVDGTSFKGEPTAEELAALRKRAASYQVLPLEEKMARATLFYHAYRLDADSLVIEYWTYYVKNLYSARPVIFPIRVGTSHPNDLEHVLLVLRPKAAAPPADGGNGHPPDPSGYEVSRILASAHNINNVFSFRAGRSVPNRVAVLVERGSHALAPDVDLDTHFEPKDDSDRDRKMIWGIRDRGATFARYRVKQADPRPTESSVALCYDEADAESLRREGFRKVFNYRLVDQDYLDGRYQELEATSKEGLKALAAGPGWVKRLFGEPERGDQLLLPSRHEDFGHPKEMADRRVLRERGFTVGLTTMMERNLNLTLGGRWTWPLRGRWTPDLMWDNQLFVTLDKTVYFSTEALGFYPLDAMTKLFGGGGLIIDPTDASRRQWSFLGGFEFRLGRFRIHNAIRQVGPLYKHAFDFRLYYVF